MVVMATTQILTEVDKKKKKKLMKSFLSWQAHGNRVNKSADQVEPTQKKTNKRENEQYITEFFLFFF